MKGLSNKKSKFRRSLTLITSLALALSCVIAAPVNSEENSECGVAMYIPTTDTTGVLSAWEGSNPNTANWWETSAYSYDSQRATIKNKFLRQNSEVYLNLDKPVTTADLAHIVIGVKSDKNAVLSMYFSDKETKDVQWYRLANFEIKEGFHEYTLNTSEANLWENNKDTGFCSMGNGWNEKALYDRFRFTWSGERASENPLPISAEFAYIRFVNNEYDGYMYNAWSNGTEVANGEVNYDPNNNIADFVFQDELDIRTVNPSTVTVNGKSAEWVMVSPYNDQLRVNMGKLAKNTHYTVRFDGIKTKEGENVTDEFAFTTPSVASISEAVTPIIKSVDTKTGVVNSWEGVNPSDGSKWSSELGSLIYEYDAQRGTMKTELLKNDELPCLEFDEHISTADVKNIVIGLKSDKDTILSIYYSHKDGSLGDEWGRVANFDVKKGFHEYVLNVADVPNEPNYWIGFQGWTASDYYDRFRFYWSGERDAGDNKMYPLDLEFAYVRFVNDSYTGFVKDAGNGAQINYENFMQDYDANNNIVDFVFPYDLDMSKAEAENVKLNGVSASWILAQNSRSFRAYFGAMKPAMRSRLTISGLQNADNADITVNEYRFTTKPIEDTSGKSAPIMSWELVENYKTADETFLTKDTSLGRKTITAVTGGLYNNSNENKTYALMLARYKEGVLEELKVEQKILGAYEMIGEQTVQMNVPDDGNTYTLKAFAWDYENINPLCRAITSSDSKESKPLKVLILGNSITYHQAVNGWGWFGNWGMAASAQDKDYVHQLISSVKSKYPLLQFKAENISLIENNFDTDIAAYVRGNAAYKECADYNADIIILTIGGNIHNSEEHTFTKEKYGEIVNVFKTNPNAKVIVGATTITDDEINAVLTEYAANNNLPLVDMAFTSEEHPEYFPSGDEYSLPAIYTHPNDAGMKAMADKLEPVLWQAINSYHTN